MKCWGWRCKNLFKLLGGRFLAKRFTTCKGSELGFRGSAFFFQGASNALITSSSRASVSCCPDGSTKPAWAHLLPEADGAGGADGAAEAAEAAAGAAEADAAAALASQHASMQGNLPGTDGASQYTCVRNLLAN